MKSVRELFDFKTTEMRIAQRALKEINKLEKNVSKLSDAELKETTNIFKSMLAEGYTLEQIRSDVFAVAREATKRVLGKRPYDVQMLGGILLDLGSVAEMKTGEGKTITSIAPVYLNALLGKGAIVSTVNEYLSERDAKEMGEVFNFLGLSVGINKAQMNPNEKRKAYAADITYSVHSELGFDYLRDNMVENMNEKVQRGLHFCLVDEVDSILIDEAKTPLIISGGQTQDSSAYFFADQFVRTLAKEDYLIDEESKAITLTHSGIAKANKFFNVESIYHIENSETVHLVQNALRAHKIMRNNVEYIVREGKIELVDGFTGRIMEGRSYSEGLQQAIQAKEMVEVEPETQTLATITYQNFFRMFSKLCGMTGTGKTEEQEFIDIYNMRVNVVPTNKPVIRIDEPDAIFASYEDKWNAVTEKVAQLYTKGQPVLIGTAQIEDSEELHKHLLKAGIPHTVLNAKQNASEAEIISHAGQVKAVTIATNMAGRGTDIKPSPEALALGGLYVIGTDKAESRRIDNQLRGRSGRQGDIGTSKFYISIDDPLMQRFSNYDSFKEAYSDSHGKEVTNKNLRFAFNHAQKKIEGFNYDSRKSVLNYDDVIRQQRDLIYSQRDLILDAVDPKFIIEKMIKHTTNSIVNFPAYKGKHSYNYNELVDFLNKNIGSLIAFNFSLKKISRIYEKDLPEYISNVIIQAYDKWRANALKSYLEQEIFQIEKQIILSTLDQKWKRHINRMEKLRSNVNLVQYSQKNPYQIYTQEGTRMFEDMVENIAFDVMLQIFSNRLGAHSLITREMEEDPIFQEIYQSFTNNDLSKSPAEREQEIIEVYKSVKARMEEITASLSMHDYNPTPQEPLQVNQSLDDTETIEEIKTLEHTENDFVLENNQENKGPFNIFDQESFLPFENFEQNADLTENSVNKEISQDNNQESIDNFTEKNQDNLDANN
ncbi:preprotein translocase subunit SecA [Mycoplasmopsis citelli]|uniref:Protein translocase subunit SecA n=1 Tax=Mycoplasmopsis citelli TaxID=171281 RepID=A0A449B130_9BACT|nr:preprotein translocase subunit SecA [Mycoplasmopsis citelli]VEU74308.1 preprotein translocase subunit SecA [Mycoplasmopsis citelli]